LGRNHFKTLLRTHLFQHRKITLAITAKVKIVAYHQALNTETTNQQVIDKLLSGKAAHGAVKLQANHSVDTRIEQGIDLFTQAHQTGRCLLAGKILAGLGLKHRHDGGQAIMPGTFIYLGNNLLVPMMDTIKRAYSGDAAPMLLAQVV